jgi:hypothetical protein
MTFSSQAECEDVITPTRLAGEEACYGAGTTR